jgi:hypothetical protein
MGVVYYFVALDVIRNQMELCRSFATLMLCLSLIFTALHFAASTSSAGVNDPEKN